MSARPFVFGLVAAVLLLIGAPSQAHAEQLGVKLEAISDSSVASIQPQAFTGDPVEPAVTVAFGERMLRQPCDYLVLYSNNVRPGLARAIVVGRGLYTGVAVVQFEVSASYVMVGDSYAVCDDVTWPAVTAEMLGLNRGAARLSPLYASGFGFAAPGEQFASLLAQAPRDTGVSDVLIVGGAGNDLQKGCSVESVDEWYRQTIALAREKFPNARIMHAIPNWHFGDEMYRTVMDERIPLYRGLADECGVFYLPSCENALRVSPDLMQRDGNHPNAEGSRAIATALVQDIGALNAALG